MKRTLLFTTIASILTLGTAYASSVVTSQTYVDAQDELKQDKIPESGVNIDENGVGETVITYTDTAGVLGERGIFDGSTTYDSSTDSDKLVTAAVLQSVQSTVDNLSTTTVTRKTCTEWVANASHTDSNCLLWNLTEVPGYIDNSCSSTADCDWMDCTEEPGTAPHCMQGTCECSSR